MGHRLSFLRARGVQNAEGTLASAHSHSYIACRTVSLSLEALEPGMDVSLLSGCDSAVAPSVNVRQADSLARECGHLRLSPELGLLGSFFP